MTNKQLYTLCGIITFSASVIANSAFMALFAIICFIISIVETEKK